MFPQEHSWQIQEAKAHFSEVIKKAIHARDQFITNRGEEVAVVISKARYDSFLTQDKSLLDFFYSAPYSSEKQLFSPRLRVAASLR